METARGLREERPVGVLVIDLDEFKTINDDHDHVFGDYVLRKVAEVLRGALRPFDTAARMGGDEFAVLLPGTTVEAARRIAERLRLAVAALVLRQGGHETGASITIGAASWDPKGDEPFEETLRGADRALLSAKRAGRNRVAVYAGPVPDDLELEDEEGEGEPPAGEGEPPAPTARRARGAAAPAKEAAAGEAEAGDGAPAGSSRKRRGLRRTRSK
jgi:diguanylate cyclase (GGDEF)-like protein